MLHGIIASISPNKGANKSTLQKISLYKFKTSIQMYTSWKQQLKKIFLKDQISQRITKLFLEL